MRGDLRGRRRLVGAGALAVMALGMAACGGGSPGNTVASIGGSSHNGTSNGGSGGPGSTGSNTGGGVTAAGGGPGTGQQSHMVLAGGKNSLQFSQCMQTHGEPNFPDPGAGGTISMNGVDPGSPAFERAMNDCRKYLPSGGKPLSGAALAKLQQQLLAFSACMRANGVPSFPDPSFLNGGATVRIGGPSSGVDPRSPQFQHAQSVCQKDLSGLPGGGKVPAFPAGGGGKGSN
jgi:hypothetical protein